MRLKFEECEHLKPSKALPLLPVLYVSPKFGLLTSFLETAEDYHTATTRLLGQPMSPTPAAGLSCDLKKMRRLFVCGVTNISKTIPRESWIQDASHRSCTSYQTSVERNGARCCVISYQFYELSCSALTTYIMS